MRKLFLISLFFLMPSLTYALDVADPFEPSIEQKAMLALQPLGPSKGALTLADPEIYQILGVSMGLVANVKDLNAAIKDLNADVRKNEIVIDLSSDILFEFDSAEIKDSAKSELKKVIVIITKKGTKVVILGHTDSKGSDEYNMDLSLKRANSVKDWLSKNGKINDSIFVTKGLGETQPVSPNENPDGSDNPEGRAKNRRVNIIVKTI